MRQVRYASSEALLYLKTDMALFFRRTDQANGPCRKEKILKGFTIAKGGQIIFSKRRRFVVMKSCSGFLRIQSLGRIL